MQKDLPESVQVFAAIPIDPFIDSNTALRLESGFGE